MIYRTLAGRSLFSGIIAKKSARIKQGERVEGKSVKHKLKFTAVVTARAEEGEKAHMVIEHLEAKFLRQADMENFEKVYTSVSS